MAPNSEKKKILVVDDNEAQLEITELLLKDEYEVKTVKSGKEALDHFMRGYIPDMILLDILMPNMDGWETYIKIRGIDFLKDIPIVFFTTVIEAAEKQHAVEIGAADYITKPYKSDDLINRIEKVLNINEANP